MAEQPRPDYDEDESEFMAPTKIHMPSRLPSTKTSTKEKTKRHRRWAAKGSGKKKFLHHRRQEHPTKTSTKTKTKTGAKDHCVGSSSVIAWHAPSMFITMLTLHVHTVLTTLS